MAIEYHVVISRVIILIPQQILSIRLFDYCILTGTGDKPSLLRTHVIIITAASNRMNARDMTPIIGMYV